MVADGDGVWHYDTLWSVSRDLLRDAWPTIHVHRISWVNPADGTGEVVLEEDPDTPLYEVWPTMFRRERPVRDAPPIIDVDFVRKKKQKRTAGVKIIGPQSVLQQLMPEDDSDESVGSGDNDDDDDDLGADDPQCGIVDAALPTSTNGGGVLRLPRAQQSQQLCCLIVMWRCVRNVVLCRHVNRV